MLPVDGRRDRGEAGELAITGSLSKQQPLQRIDECSWPAAASNTGYWPNWPPNFAAEGGALTQGRTAAHWQASGADPGPTIDERRSDNGFWVSCAWLGLPLSHSSGADLGSATRQVRPTSWPCLAAAGRLVAAWA